MMLPVVADSIRWKTVMLGPLVADMTGSGPGIALDSPWSISGIILSCR